MKALFSFWDKFRYNIRQCVSFFFFCSCGKTKHRQVFSTAVTWTDRDTFCILTNKSAKYAKTISWPSIDITAFSMLTSTTIRLSLQYTVYTRTVASKLPKNLVRNKITINFLAKKRCFPDIDLISHCKILIFVINQCIFFLLETYFPHTNPNWVLKHLQALTIMVRYNDETKKMSRLPAKSWISFSNEAGWWQIDHLLGFIWSKLFLCKSLNTGLGTIRKGAFSMSATKYLHKKQKPINAL